MLYTTKPVMELPTESGYFFCLCKGGNHIVYFDKDAGIWGRGRKNETNWADIITHWLQPLPTVEGLSEDAALDVIYEQNHALLSGSATVREIAIECMKEVRSDCETVLAQEVQKRMEETDELKTRISDLENEHALEMVAMAEQLRYAERSLKDAEQEIKDVRHGGYDGRDGY